MNHHAPHHWIAVAFALAALTLTITEANGQTPLRSGELVGKTQKDIIRKPDTGVARDQRSTVKKTRRAAKSVAQQARTGVIIIDSASQKR